MSNSNEPRMVETLLRVRFAETDAMGIAHHANYLVYFEAGRVELSRQGGASYADLEASGFSLAVSEVEIRYIAPAQFDQWIGVQAQVEDVRSRSVRFSYQIVDAETQQLLVTGRTKHICVNRDGEVCRIPDGWRKAIEKLSVS